MKKNLTRQWLAALMVAAGLLTALPIEAQKETKDISDWSENTSFGKNGANATADGYSPPTSCKATASGTRCRRTSRVPTLVPSVPISNA